MLENERAGVRWITIALVLLMGLGQSTLAQSRADEKKILTLEEAVEFALKNYPAVRAALDRVTAAQAGVGLARTSYLPRADMVWQTNQATDNNITGLVLPQSIIAPISGPVPASTSNRSAWGSAAGLLFSWEPLARAGRDRTTAEASLTRLDVAVATVNDLTVLAAQRTVRAAEASVYLRDVGSVKDTTDVLAGYALLNGQRTIYIPVTKRPDASTITVVNEVLQNIERFPPARPRRVRGRPES